MAADQDRAVTITAPERLLERLMEESHESAWLEFKIGNSNPEMIAEYVSALANSAMLSDRDRAYLVFGVDDKTREAVGTKVILSSLKG